MGLASGSERVVPLLIHFIINCYGLDWTERVISLNYGGIFWQSRRLQDRDSTVHLYQWTSDAMHTEEPRPGLQIDSRKCWRNNRFVCSPRGVLCKECKSWTDKRITQWDELCLFAQIIHSLCSRVEYRWSQSVGLQNRSIQLHRKGKKRFLRPGRWGSGSW